MAIKAKFRNWKNNFLPIFKNRAGTLYAVLENADSEFSN